MSARAPDGLPADFVGGVLVVDKPAGPTSHDVVARVRRLSGLARVGHTGTLDPFATGVLPLVLGRATRLARFMAGSRKAYVAEVRLGVSTDTDDVTGTPLPGVAFFAKITPDPIKAALERFRGPHLQRPPAFSAKKVEGVRAHRLARRDRPVELEPVLVDLSHLELLGVEGPQVSLSLECSAGFYVRALARDLGLALGCGAHLTALRRTRAGEFTLADAVPLARLEQDPASLERLVMPLDRMLTWLPAASLGSSQVERVRHGNPVKGDDVDWASMAGPHPATNLGGTDDGPYVRLLGPGGHLVAVARSMPGGSHGAVLQPTVVLV